MHIDLARYSRVFHNLILKMTGETDDEFPHMRNFGWYKVLKYLKILL